jgi:hypothetical protein
MTHDTATLAYLAVIAICLVLIGALLTAGPLSVEQRGTVLGAIFGALAFVGWRSRKGPA